MEITVEKIGYTIYITLDGNLDTEGDKELAKTLRAVQRLGECDHFVFNMCKVFYATSSGIGRINNFYKVLENTERLMEINGISNSLFEQFTDIHLEVLFPINKDIIGEMHVFPGYKALLGEGIIWDHIKRKIAWIDIEGKKLIIQDVNSKNTQIVALSQRPGSVALMLNNNMLLALRDGVYHFNPETGSMDIILHNEFPQKTRFNDGKCDPKGRFWVGTMDLAFKNPIGKLYRIDKDLSVHEMISSIIISNGITWSLDKKWMYYIDSGTRKVAAYRYNNDSGDIIFHSNIIEIPETMGYPDGCTIDEEGMLWIALWGGHAITRWNPHNGDLLKKIEVPALNVTSLAFGGPAMNTLFITTANINTPNPSQYPKAGSLFFFKPGVGGIAAPYFDQSL